MAGLFAPKNEPSERRHNKEENPELDFRCNTEKSFNFTIIDLVILILSVLSIIMDIFTDLVLVVQYSNQGYKVWAISTLVLIFLPSVVVQFFSLRWHIVDKTANMLHWALHFCMLGVVHRYIQLIRNAVLAYKSKNASTVQKVVFDQNDLCMLHLFESFLESAPQLVLQIYVIVMVHEWRFWTEISALASLLSLGWALAAYTKAQRRASENKNSTTWPGLLLQAVWRTGMLTSRISALVLGAYCFGNYFFLLMSIHWISMTIWIINQKTDFCDTYWEEKIYNTVVGFIYCFCFFNLQEGHSRWRALAFYLVVIFENLTFLTIYLMWFGEKTPKLAVAGFVSIIGGTIIGLSSMLFYYRFFHPSGPIKFFLTFQSSQAVDSSQPYSSLTLRSLKGKRYDSPNKNLNENLASNSIDVLHKSSFLDSVIIVEENALHDSDDDIKILQDWINEEINNKALVTSSEDGTKEAKTSTYEFRSICPSFDKLIEFKSGRENENEDLKPTDIREGSSEILSTHDYENLCAVNIAREGWGLRSWQAYFDIETWLHDDSVVHDGQLDTLTSTESSDQSANILEKENPRTTKVDAIDRKAANLTKDDAKASLDNILHSHSIESRPVVYPLNTSDFIVEETKEDKINNRIFNNLNIKHNTTSTLVATIDEIGPHSLKTNIHHLITLMISII